MGPPAPLALAAALLALAGPALAEESPPPPNADAASSLGPICTDRPTKSTAPCTVPAGHFQIESDVFNFTVDETGGADTETWLVTNPTLKYGLTDRLDIEVNWAPWQIVSQRDSPTSETREESGIGDLYLRAKANVLGGSGGKISIALAPFLKLPTATRPLGNGAVEGGLIVPVNVNLPHGWSATFDPEADIDEDASGAGRHLALLSLVSLSRPVSSEVTLSLELWGEENFDPAGRVEQASGDIGIAWIPKARPWLQLDGGVNLGLNRATPASQIYVGISRRF
ncbi:MAG: transporter [Caulobacteraceae bacterium]